MNTNNIPESILCAKDGSAMPLDRVSVQGTLRDFAAEITVEQYYRNNRAKNVEAVYTFPLPIGAVLLDLELEIGARRLVGQVVEKKIAEQRYEDAVTDGDTAVMIEVTGPGLYTLNFGNLMAGESAVIRYRYAMLLTWHGDRVRLVLPTTLAPRYGDPANAGLADHQTPETSLNAEYPFKLNLDITGKLADGEITSPTHIVSMSRDGDSVSVTLGDSAKLDRDFVLLMRGTQESSACIFDDGGAEKVILASLRIPPLPKKDEKPLRLKVVIDCSGSMAGIGIAQARKAALAILGQLRPGDRFNFTLFGSSVEHFWSDLVPAEASYISMASKQLEELDANLGGTETGHAMRAAYTMGDKPTNALTRLASRLRREMPQRQKDDITPQILLITDGQVWDYKAIVREAIDSHHRIFTVGVGLSAVEGLVGELAKQTGGACELVSPQEGMAERVMAQFHRLRQPRVILKGIKLGKKPNWFSPLSKSAFAGDTVHVYAGIAGAPPDKLTLGATTANGVIFSVEIAINRSEWTDLPRMAAAARIASPKVSEDDKLSLALKHQLLTDKTNLLIVAEREAKAEELPELAKVAHMLPAGWGGTGGVAEGLVGLRTGTDLAGAFITRRSVSDSFCASSGVDKYSIPAFLRKFSDDASSQPMLSVLFDSDARMEVASAHGETPRNFIANVFAGLPNFQNPEGLPTTIEVLEEYGLPPEIATSLREIFSDGWPERIIVAAFLMAMTEQKSLSGEFPREFSRLIFANWKRTDTNRLLLDRVEALISQSVVADWKLGQLQLNSSVPS